MTEEEHIIPEHVSPEDLSHGDKIRLTLNNGDSIIGWFIELEANQVILDKNRLFGKVPYDQMTRIRLDEIRQVIRMIYEEK